MLLLMDAQGRQLERSAALGDRAAALGLLRHRLRAGGLSDHQLEVLVLFGDELAGEALGRRVQAWPTTGRHMRGEQSDRLSRCGTDVLARVGAALAHAALALVDDERARTAADAIDDWVLCPCDEHAERAERAGAGGAEQAVADASDERVRCGADCVVAVALAVSRQQSAWTRVHGRTRESGHQWTVGDIRRAIESGSVAGLELLDVVRGEVWPWLLGLRDPVRERVAARGP